MPPRLLEDQILAACKVPAEAQAHRYALRKQVFDPKPVVQTADNRPGDAEADKRQQHETQIAVDTLSGLAGKTQIADTLVGAHGTQEMAGRKCDYGWSLAL